LEHPDACGSLDLIDQKLAHDLEFDLQAHLAPRGIEGASAIMRSSRKS
jgi:hypothetical protein